MPLGVPKVPFLFGEDEEASWVELYNVIYRCRVLFLGDEINSETTNDIGGLMVFLNIENPKRDIHLLINSPGGEMLSGLAIYDLMQVIQPAVNTLCVGIAASMASLLLIGGQISKREAFPHAMIHQPASAFYQGQTVDYMLEANELLKMRQTMTKILCTKNRQAFMVDIQRHGKGLLYVTRRSPSLLEMGKTGF
uniref:ATP-dependent Clp protease proteolytic subunit n=1 Tax=Hedysarum taipeicum TaxID=1641298 RepID=A0A6C0W1L3_9FABA|nr:ATP-dependent Clp protease proteolytic subunit [Hedysarum taipeicum]QIC19323.1 ATP-dependent Clp protease proteolytic subunit [Hedysarum taipeicum]UFP91318.1 ATP-dependent Clp protease proteolytic subunit [Hedysarum taipeicum]